MKKTFLLLFLAFISVSEIIAQNEYIDYRSSTNPLYWKNRIPHAGYWQQDVAYKIKATVDEKTNIIEGSEELTYWNNSPDTLTFVYFHLYQNAFVNGSYLQELHKANKNPIKNLGKYVYLIYIQRIPKDSSFYSLAQQGLSYTGVDNFDLNSMNTLIDIYVKELNYVVI